MSLNGRVDLASMFLMFFSHVSQVVLFFMCFAFLFSPTKVEVHLLLWSSTSFIVMKKNIRWSARQELVSLSKVALVIGAIEWQHVDLRS